MDSSLRFRPQIVDSRLSLWPRLLHPIPAEKWQPVGTRQELEWAEVEVSDGFHRLESDTPFGVVSYGYDCRVSYAYPGGLNLETQSDRLENP